jgi:hypothetical protein
LSALDCPRFVVHGKYPIHQNDDTTASESNAEDAGKFQARLGCPERNQELTPVREMVWVTIVSSHQFEDAKYWNISSSIDCALEARLRKHIRNRNSPELQNKMHEMIP